MTCQRCNGTLFYDVCFGLEGETFEGLRCANCGDIVDPVILMNRQLNSKYIEGGISG